MTDGNWIGLAAVLPWSVGIGGGLLLFPPPARGPPHRPPAHPPVARGAAGGPTRSGGGVWAGPRGCRPGFGVFPAAPAGGTARPTAGTARPRSGPTAVPTGRARPEPR